MCSGEIDILVFFWNPFAPLPQDPDVKALLRIAAVWNVSAVCNEVSTEFLISSNFTGQIFCESHLNLTAMLRQNSLAAK